MTTTLHQDFTLLDQEQCVYTKNSLHKISKLKKQPKKYKNIETTLCIENDKSISGFAKRERKCICLSLFREHLIYILPAIHWEHDVTMVNENQNHQPIEGWIQNTKN